jgi:hypothetical protein
VFLLISPREQMMWLLCFPLAGGPQAWLWLRYGPPHWWLLMSGTCGYNGYHGIIKWGGSSC